MHNKFHADFKTIILSIKIPRITFLTVIPLCKYKDNCQQFQMMWICEDKNLSLSWVAPAGLPPLSALGVAFPENSKWAGIGCWRSGQGALLLKESHLDDSAIWLKLFKWLRLSKKSLQNLRGFLCVRLPWVPIKSGIKVISKQCLEISNTHQHLTPESFAVSPSGTFSNIQW